MAGKSREGNEGNKEGGHAKMTSILGGGYPYAYADIGVEVA